MNRKKLKTDLTRFKILEKASLFAAQKSAFSSAIFRLDLATVDRKNIPGHLVVLPKKNR